ncbi:fumarylacetoacetate hydrolase family protein [Vibrio fluvialis]
MALTVLRFSGQNSVPEWGVLFDDKVAPLKGNYTSTGDLIERGIEEARKVRASDATLLLNTLNLLAPITANQQFLCQGLNYRCHVRDSGMDPEELPFNTLFTKSPASITAAHGYIVRPGHVSLLDYEVELGVVVGSRIDGPVTVTESNLPDYASAIVIVNDISARDVQLPQGQFYKGKSYRGFGPVGPFLVIPTREEWRRLGELHLRLSVNGEVRQDCYAKDMIFSPAQTLTELSSMHNLEPGDLLATGTPAGCAAQAPKSKLTLWVLKALMPEQMKWELYLKSQMTNPRYLKPGDEMVASIATDDGLITLGEQRHQILQD